MTGRNVVLGSHRVLSVVTDDHVVAGGTDRDSATPLSGTWVRVVQVPPGSGIALWHAVAGAEIIVVRADPATRANDLVIYAEDDGDAIGDGSSIVLGGGQPSAARFVSFSEGQWDIAGSTGLIFWPDRFVGSGSLSCDAVHTPLGAGALVGRGALAARSVLAQADSAELDGGGSVIAIAA